MLTEIAQALDQATDDMLNARGRSGAHVSAGVAIAAGAVLVSALVAYGVAPRKTDALDKARRASLDKASFQPSEKTVSAVWPPMSMLLILSGLRVWNGPPSAARTRALGFWTLIQALHAVSLLWTAKQQTAQLATNLATMGAGLAYANDAKTVDPPSATIVAPYVSWMAFANLLTEELWRRNRKRPDVH